MQWTENQQKVIDTRNKNILVSAAAGSGKTAVLVERIIKLLIEEKENIDSFLIVTFTNAAAAGMKNKIKKALYTKLEDNNLDNELKKHLKKQINLLSKADISTIHSFCIGVLRKNFHEIGLDPNFRIGDPDECKILLNEAIDEALEEFYAKREDNFIKLIEGFTNNRTDNEIVEIIKDIYYFILSFPYPLKWLDEAIEMLNMNIDELETSNWILAIKKIIEMYVLSAQSILNDAIDKCNDSDGPYVYVDCLKDDINTLENLKEKLKLGFDDFLHALYSISYMRLPTIKKADKEAINELKKDEIKELRDEYKKMIEKIKKMLPNRDLKNRLEEIKFMYEPMIALRELVARSYEIFQEKKSEKSIIDFSDVEHYALEILSNKEIAKLYREKYCFIFIDEYQDSNFLQETLLGCIKRNNNMFMVGDSKQSIYKFRLADVDLFNSKLEKYPKEIDVENCDDLRIDLNNNFRSRKEILDAINFIFSNIMTKSLGELDYNNDVYLNEGMKFEPINNPVELDLIFKNNEIDKIYDDEIDDELYSMENAEIEAYYAVKKIHELVNKPIFDAKKNEYRPAKYQDIVILVRATSSMSVIFEEIFFNKNIPFYSDAASGYYEMIEIQIILNFLRIIDNTRQDIPLLSIMRSMIGGFTTEDLINIRINCPFKSSYIDAVYYYKNNYKDKLAEKINNFINLVEKYKKKSRVLPLDDLIWEMITETNYYYFVAFLPNGKMRQANLRLLTDKARDYENTSLHGVYNFLKYVDKLKATETNPATAKIVGENEDVVRMMTIHKSKGLEFPIVILCGLNKKINMADVNKNILKHKTYGIAPKYIDTELRIYKETLPREALKNIIKLETYSEEMRVLYVALTRASDKLILCGVVKNLETSLKKWRRGTGIYNLYTSMSYLDWIGSALYRHKNAGILRNYIDDFDVELIEDDCNSWWNINILSLYDINYSSKNLDEVKKYKIKDIENFKDIEKTELYYDIDKKMSFSYKFNKSINIPTKLSVTDIKALENKQKNIRELKISIPKLIDIPIFSEKEVNFTKAEIGTIVHFVMQHLNLKLGLDCDSIAKQISDMKDSRLLTEEEAEIVDISKITAFFESELGIRMLKSKDIKREKAFVLKKGAKDVISDIDDEEKEDVLVQGIIDCYFYEDDGIVLIDYKTDYVNSEDDELRIKRMYSPQIVSYREALERLTGKVVKEAYLYLFDINKAVRID